MQKELTIALAEELAPLAERASTIEITTNADLKEATEILSRLNKLNDQVEAEQDRILDPLKEAIKVEKSRWAPAITYYKAGIEAIRAKMKTYGTTLTQSTKSKEQSIASRIAPGKGHLSLETAVAHIEALPQLQKTTSTNEGSVTFVEKPQLKVTNIDLITREYFDLNESKLLKALKEGKLVPGAEIEIVLIPRNAR